LPILLPNLGFLRGKCREGRVRLLDVTLHTNVDHVLSGREATLSHRLNVIGVLPSGPPQYQRAYRFRGLLESSRHLRVVYDCTGRLEVF
jgi:hypothetical protein